MPKPTAFILAGMSHENPVCPTVAALCVYTAKQAFRMSYLILEKKKGRHDNSPEMLSCFRFGVGLATGGSVPEHEWKD